MWSISFWATVLVDKSIYRLSFWNVPFEQWNFKRLVNIALAGWLSRLQHCPVHEKFAGLIPDQGTFLHCGVNPQSGEGVDERQLIHISLSLSFHFLSPSLPVKSNKIVMWWRLKKKLA